MLAYTFTFTSTSTYRNAHILTDAFMYTHAQNTHTCHIYAQVQTHVSEHTCLLKQRLDVGGGALPTVSELCWAMSLQANIAHTRHGPMSPCFPSPWWQSELWGRGMYKVYKDLVGSGFLIPQGERLSGSEHRKVLALHSPMSFFFVVVGFVYFFWQGGEWSFFSWGLGWCLVHLYDPRVQQRWVRVCRIE